MIGTCILLRNSEQEDCLRAIFHERRSSVLAWLFIELVIGLIAIGSLIGCGTTKSYSATEQLLVSDAVDSTVSQIDFRPLEGQRVFLDNSFMPTQKGVPTPTPSLVHSEYVMGSLRQQMVAAGVMLCDKRDEADLIVEVRLGALGFDGHAVSYGVPASSTLSTAANSLAGASLLPALPEISFARKEAKNGAAKVALFAYERQSMQPVWQSGIARATSTARDTWILGVGPLQNGTIYQGPAFAGGRLLRGPVAKMVRREDDEPEMLVDYKRPQVFAMSPKPNGQEVQTADSKPTDTTKPVSTAAESPAKPVPSGSSSSAVQPATAQVTNPAGGVSAEKPPAALPQPTPGPIPSQPSGKEGSASSRQPTGGVPTLHIDDKAQP